MLNREPDFLVRGQEWHLRDLAQVHSHIVICRDISRGVHLKHCTFPLTQVTPQPTPVTRVAQPPEGLALDLAGALPRHAQFLPDFF